MVVRSQARIYAHKCLSTGAGGNNVVDVSKLGERLRQIRKRIGMTQAELASRSMVSQQTISKLESGRARSTTELVKIARALNVTADYLYGAESEEFVGEIYDLIMSLPPDRREDVLVMLRTLAKR